MTFTSCPRPRWGVENVRPVVCIFLRIKQTPLVVRASWWGRRRWGGSRFLPRSCPFADGLPQSTPKRLFPTILSSPGVIHCRHIPLAATLQPLFVCLEFGIQRNVVRILRVNRPIPIVTVPVHTDHGANMNVTRTPHRMYLCQLGFPVPWSHSSRGRTLGCINTGCDRLVKSPTLFETLKA